MDSARIEIKSIGTLMDELITTSMKCWHAQEQIMLNVPDAAKAAQVLNARRNALIQAIDRRLGDSEITPTGKTYR